MRESWGPVGAGLNGRRWAFGEEDEEEGCWAGEQLIGSPVAEEEDGKKKLLMVLLHDWAFVTAIVLPATSARATVV